MAGIEIASQGVLDELLLPSRLGGNGDRHAAIRNRLAVVRAHAEKMGLPVASQHQEDDHFWFTVMRGFSSTLDVLHKFLPNTNIRSAALALAVQNAGETLKTEQESALDKLTEAWSRRSLDTFLTNVLNTAHRRVSVVGVLMVDVDHFKKYNDSEGHQAGDRILIDLVRVLQGSVRGSDMVARYGGEEFTVVLPVLAAPRAASVRAEDFRRKIADRTRVTVSIGVTTVQSSDANIEPVFERADKNLYRAKAGGRNTVFDDNGRVVLRGRGR